MRAGTLLFLVDLMKEGAKLTQKMHQASGKWLPNKIASLHIVSQLTQSLKRYVTKPCTM